MHWQRYPSLNQVLTVVLSLMILITLSINTGVMYHYVNFAEKDLILKQYQIHNETGNRLLTLYWDMLQQEIKDIASRLQQEQLLSPNKKHSYQQYFQPSGYIEPENLFFIEDNMHLISAPNLPQQQQQQLEAQSKTFYQNNYNPYWSPVYTDEQNRGYIFYLHPVLNALKSKITTTIGLKISFSSIHFLDTHQFLLSEHGKFLSPIQFPIQPEIIHQGFQNYKKQPQNNVINSPPWHFIFNYLPKLNVYLVHIVDKKDIQTIAAPLLKHLLWICLVSTCLLLALHHHFLYYIFTKPMANFLNTLKKMNHRALDTRLEHIPFAEFEQISFYFQQLLQEIHNHQIQLEQKIIERTQALHQAKKQAEQANARKSMHLSAVSHELRTPLNGILGNIQLLEISPDLPRKSKRLILHAKNSSLALLELIENLLDFSRIERGEITLHPKTFDLLPFLEQITTTLAPLAHQKYLHLQVLIGAQVPEKIHTDPMRLRQILINLIGNSIKFTQKGHIKISVFAHGYQVYFYITDTGIGMEKTDIANIFQPFTQLNDDFSGIGLGLNISQQFVNKLGGTLKVRSRPGRYTTFCCIFTFSHQTQHHKQPRSCQGLQVKTKLPLQRQLQLWGASLNRQASLILTDTSLMYSPATLWKKLSIDSTTHTAPVENKSKIHHSPWLLKILVVDDIEINRDVATQMLESLGHQTLQASSGDQAIELGKQHIFDLVLLDLRMPKRSGLEILQEWRHHQDILDPHCFIALLTANASAQEEAKAIKQGVNAYLIKPLDWEQLQQVIANVVNFQIHRDIDLLPNPKMQRPVLQQQTSHQRAIDELKQLTEQLEQAEKKNEQREILHKIAGICAYAGWETIRERANFYEHQLNQEHNLTQETLNQFIHELEETIKHLS